MSLRTSIVFSFKNSNSSIKLIISQGSEWAVPKNTKSNFIFNLIKNLWGCCPVNNFQLFVNSGKYWFPLYPVFLDLNYNDNVVQKLKAKDLREK